MISAKVVIGASSLSGNKLPARGDRAALEYAVQRFPAPPDAYCVCGDEGALRYALAAGAATAQVLTDVSAVCGDWVLVGPGGLAASGDWLAAEIAERLSGALVFEVCDLIAAAASKLVVLRDLGDGDRDEVEVQAPAVIVFGEKAVPRHYVSRYRQRVVLLAPIDVAAGLRDPLLGFSDGWDVLRPRPPHRTFPLASIQAAEDRANSVFGVEQSPTQTNGAGLRIQADPRTCAMHLLRYLIHYELLPQHIEMPLPALPVSQPQVLTNPIHRRPTNGLPAIETRTPRLLGQPPGAGHRRQPRLISARGGHPTADLTMFPPTPRVPTAVKVHAPTVRDAPLPDNA